MGSCVPCALITAKRLRGAYRVGGPVAILAEVDGGASWTTVLVRDAGFTEVAPGTVTRAARYPAG